MTERHVQMALSLAMAMNWSRKSCHDTNPPPTYSVHSDRALPEIALNPVKVARSDGAISPWAYAS